jgi:hypothetical protein
MGALGAGLAHRRRLLMERMSMPWVRRSSPLQQGQVLVLLTSTASLGSKSAPQMSQLSRWMVSVGFIVFLRWGADVVPLSLPRRGTHSSKRRSRKRRTRRRRTA